MTRFAFGAKWGRLAPLGVAESDGWSKDAKAAAPMPVLARLRKCLRVRWRSGSGCMAVYSLVTVSSRLSSVLATVV